MSTVLFGNPNPMMRRRELHVHDDGTRNIVDVPYRAPHLEQSETRVEMWDGFDDPDFVALTLSTGNDRMLSMIAERLGGEHRGYAVGVRECEQLLGEHSGGAAPTWVESDDEAFARALAAHFGCPVGRPTMLLTNGGRDAIHAQTHGTSAQPAAFNYGALTANATAASAADTTLTAEIATASGGLVRGQMTYAHTVGTNTSTLTKTWTANGSDVLPVTLAKWASFNAASVGTMGNEILFGATVTLTNSGDNITVTFTDTIG